MNDDIPEEVQDSKKVEESREELIAIFREHWNHARHCENERLWFTNIYAVIVAAILVFVGNAVYSESPDYGSAVLLTLFGFILSIIGFVIIIALSLGYLHHIVDIVVVYYYWNKMEFYKHPRKSVHFGAAHRWFFEITIALFLVLSLSYSNQAEILPELPLIQWIPCPLLWVITFVGIEIVYWKTWEKKYSGKCIEFMNELRNVPKEDYRKDWPTELNTLRKKIFGEI